MTILSSITSDGRKPDGETYSFTKLSLWEDDATACPSTVSELVQVNCYDGSVDSLVVSTRTTDYSSGEYILITVPEAERFDPDDLTGGFYLSSSTDFTSVLEIEGSTDCIVEHIRINKTGAGDLFSAESAVKGFEATFSHCYANMLRTECRLKAFYCTLSRK